MDNQRKSANDRPQEPGYETPGADTVIYSNDAGVPSPSETSDQRLQKPKPVIQSINETPGDANPALNETIAAEQGKADTADLLRARESAEGQQLRKAGAQIYEDQPPDAEPAAFEQEDGGRPTWPDNREEPPIEKMESPHSEASYMAGSPDYLGLNWKGRVDEEMDRNAKQAAAQDSPAGFSTAGQSPEEARDEQLEMDHPTPQSDADRLMPGMVHLPPEDSEK